MPIYEFYCKECNTIYKFFSRTINTETIPNCPTCESTQLERTMSTFATLSKKSGSDTEEDMNMPDIDESKMESAMAMLAREAEGMDEDDPKQAANLMRKLSDSTGLKMGPGMEEALSRLERGEDPEQIEADMGDILEGQEPFLLGQKSTKTSKKKRPRRDDTLYDL